MIRRLLIALAVLVPALVVPVTTPGQAVQVSHDQLVSDDPADWTPDVLDGEVKSIVAVGDQMVVSGTFTQVQESGGGEVLARERIFAFDARTGVINRSFAPSINGEVTTVLPDPGGAAVFAAGSFTSVNGTTNRKLTRLDLADGGISDSFRNVAVDAKVTDLRFVHGELILGGSFTSVQGIPRTGLASVNPATGDLTDFMDVNIADPLRGTMNVYKMDVTPDQDRLVFIGNFATVESQSRPQLAVLETGGPTATLADWASPFYALDACDERWWSYMRDVDIDSTGTYFVITTSGAYRGPDAPCDMEARWEVDQTGVDLDPTWRAYTGGDTTYAVAVTDSVVYVGGHMRWFNNPWAWNQWGAGGVSRMGIAALDPKNGLPFSWNPGRNPRGVGVFDIHSTDQGLWIGSDTDWVAGEQHRKLAFFPLEGGGRLPAERVGALPNDVFTLSDASGTEDSLRFRFLDGDTGIGGGESYTGDENGPDQWQDARGAVLIDDTLYTAWADGTFRAHPVNGRDIGEGVVQDLYGDPEAKGADEWFGTDARSVTGMFFDPETHRLYYTMDGDPTLWWRAFTPESGVVGAARFPAQGETDGLRPERIQGMFSAGDHFYFADATEGHLYRTGFEGGAVTGSPELVDDHVDWRGRGMFLWNAEPATLEPADPVAVPSITCAGLTCDFDGTESTDTDGYVADWDWELGDGSFEEGRLVRYTYGTPGTYDVRLTVTDNSGRSHSVNVPVSVTRPPATNIRFQGARSASANWTSVSVASPPGIEAGDGLLLFVTTSQPAAVSPPDGWTKVGEQSGRELVTQLFSAVADGSAAGNVTVDLDRIVKADATLLAYSGTSVDDPVLDWASLREFDRTGAHEAPDTRVDADTTRLIHYWADKSSATTSWQTPDGFDRRSQSIGSGSGRVNSVVVDRAVTPEPTGWIPGSVATANDASDKATMWTLRLRAEPSELPPAAVDPVAVLDVSCVDLVCELDGSGSHDADGEVVSWSWDHGDGSSSEGVSSSHVFAGAGEYPVTLTVTDDSGASASASQVVSVSEPPAAVDPVAVLDVSCVDLVCELDGSGSHDADGEVVSWSWDHGDGSSSEGVSSSHVFAGAGEYPVTLTVTDDSGASASASQVVSVSEPPAAVDPVAVLDVSCVDLVCELDGSGSHDADGEVVSWSWDHGDGSSSEGVSSSHVFAGAGEYPVTLTVTDDSGASASASQVVSVSEPPAAVDPVAVLDVSCVDLVCELDGSGSHDADGEVVSWSWDHGDGSSSEGVSSSHVFAGAGEYPVTLTVTDDSGASASASQVVSVSEPPAAVDPVAVLDVSCVDLVCELDGSGSHDADGEVVSWSWDHGDGSSSEGVSSSHVFAGAGEYPVTLTVTDDSGASASASQVVSVSEPPAAVDTVEAVGSATASENETSTSLTIPSVVESGDLMLLFVTTNEAVDVASVPSGWELIGEEPGRQIVTRLYQRVASASDAGSTLTVEMATVIKTDLTLLAYRGASPVDPASDWASASESDKAMEHAAPGLAAWDGASVIVNYWSDKTSSATGWSAPSSHTLRSESVGSGGGRITSLAADLSWATGAVPSFTAASDAETSKATMWSVRLRPS